MSRTPNNKVSPAEKTTTRALSEIREKTPKPTPAKITPQANFRATLQARTNDHLQKLREQRFEDDLLGELAAQRLLEAKKRLKNFVVYSDLSDTVEKRRLLKYFQTKYPIFIKLMTELARMRKFNKGVQQPQQVEVHELKQVFILKNKSEYVSIECTPQEQQKTNEDNSAQCRAVLKRKKLGEKVKIFKVIGGYKSLVECLEARGMSETDWSPKFDKEKFRETGFHFLYTAKVRDCFRMPLAKFQYVNHIIGAKALTTKIGLTHMMKNLIWRHDRDIHENFPVSYDISSLQSEECAQFREDFKFNQVVAFLKQSQNFTKKQVETLKEQLVIALTIVERRNQSLSGELFQKMLTTTVIHCELDIVSDSVYEMLRTSRKIAEDFSRQAWYRPLMKAYADVSVSDLRLKIKEVLKAFAELIGKKQYDLNIGKNAWILKPGVSSRGRGIEIHSDLEDLLRSTMSAKESNWVVQKYIERPLIIIGKKFDMRVWVVVTSVEPFAVWMFMKPYLRFTSGDYDANRLFDKFSHLTNFSVSKKGKQNKSKGKYSIQSNMWTSEQFQEFLINEYSEVSDDPFVDKILPQIKEGVIDSLLAVRDVLHHRDRSHEMFGYDFMVDAALNVWLIEVNSSPSMEHSTSITEKLVPKCFQQLTEIIFDYDHGHSCSVGDSVGDFEMIFFAR